MSEILFPNFRWDAVPEPMVEHINPDFLFHFPPKSHLQAPTQRARQCETHRHCLLEAKMKRGTGGYRP